MCDLPSPSAPSSVYVQTASRCSGRMKVAISSVYRDCNLPKEAGSGNDSDRLTAADVPANGRSVRRARFDTVRKPPARAHHLSYRCSVLYCFAASGETRSEQSPAGEENEGTQCVPEIIFAAAMQDSAPPQGVDQHCNPCIHALLQCSLKTPVKQRRRHICHTQSCDSKNARQAA